MTLNYPELKYSASEGASVPAYLHPCDLTPRGPNHLIMLDASITLFLWSQLTAVELYYQYFEKLKKY